jgi:hypothetical protein
MQLMGRVGLAAILSLSLGAAACNRGPNPTDEVNRALKDAKLDTVNVDWDKAGASRTSRAPSIHRPTSSARMMSQPLPSARRGAC